MDLMQKRLEEIHRKITMAAHRGGCGNQEVTLVAVSKMVEQAEVRKAYDLGIRDFGENRVQELNRKMDCLPQARWHLIGRLQTNKVKDVVGRVSLIHSLDRWPLALAINQRAEKLGIRVPVLVQVNISGEESKAGLSVDEVESFLDSVGELSALHIQGLMTIAVQESLPEASRPVFRELAQLRHKLQGIKYHNVELKYLSMGMSQDYEVAVEEGANLVRIGSALFK
jgi:pyridoxal phosphate enzyme (YggS family)